MEYRQLGRLFETSVGALGGGGIGQIWGPTDDAEAVATVRAAVDAGITLLDVAPLYGIAETMIGRAFEGVFPKEVRVSTKCMLGTPPAVEVADRLSASLDESCGRLRRPYVDVFFLHGYVIEDGWHEGPRAHLLDRLAMPLTLYRETIVPALQALVTAGRIGAWGITSGPPAPVTAALTDVVAPCAFQAVVNPLNTSGSMNITGKPEDPAALIPIAAHRGIGVMAVRALAAGALTDAFDRNVDPETLEAIDYQRAAGFRMMARELGVEPAELAYRYALSTPGVDTVVLGAKNRSELMAFMRAEAAPRMSPAEMADLRAGTLS